MKLLFIGDIVGQPGRNAVKTLLPNLREQHALDFVIANGENSAGGSGITPKTADEIFSAGVDVITSGDHLWDQKEVMELWELTDEAQLEGLAKNNILPSRPALANNKYFAADPRIVTTAKALAIGYVPWVYHFADMVNSNSIPWINMLQRAIFDGDVDGAIKEAREKMKAIAAE